MDKIVPLTENYEFKRAYARGKTAVRTSLVVYAYRRKGQPLRVGITASKKIGNAVLRNRARRLLRETLRTVYDDLLPGYDLVLVARGKTPFGSYHSIYPELCSALAELSVLSEKKSV